MISLNDNEINEVIELISDNKFYDISRNIPCLPFGRQNLVSFLKDFYRNYYSFLDVGSVVYIVDFVNESNFTKECIDIVYKNKDKLVFFRGNFNRLLFRLGSVDSILDFVQKNKKGFEQIDIVDLCLFLIKEDSINKRKYVDFFIKNRNEFNLRATNLVLMIASMSDDEFIKSFIDERDKYGFDNKNLCILMENVKDENYILSCLKHIQDFNIDDIYLPNLLLHFKNPSRVIDKLIMDKSIPVEKRVSLVVSTKDSKLIDKCLNKRKLFNLSKDDTIKLLTWASSKTKYKCIKNPLLYGLDDELDLFPIYMTLGKESKAKEILKNQDLKKFAIPNRTKTPDDMLFGIEIECTGLKNFLYTDFSFLSSWKGKSEGSITNGLEVTSPPSNSNQYFVNALNKVTTILKKCNFFVNSSCGGHIHFDLGFFDDQQDVYNKIGLQKNLSLKENEKAIQRKFDRRSLYSLKNLLEIWNNNEDLFYIISNPEGEVTKKNRLIYANSTSKKWEDFIKNGSVDINSEEDLRDFKNQIRISQDTRYVSLNLREHGKHTVEFRLSNASLDPNTWMDNISLYGGLLEFCRNLTRIMIKDENERTPDDIKKLQMVKVLNYSNISRDERINLLLDLICQDKEQKVLFKKRYDVNSKLFDKDEDLSYFLNNKLAKRPLLFRPKDTYFKDIKSDEYTQVSNSIENELEQKNKVEEI